MDERRGPCACWRRVASFKLHDSPVCAVRPGGQRSAPLERRVSVPASQGKHADDHPLKGPVFCRHPVRSQDNSQLPGNGPAHSVLAPGGCQDVARLGAAPRPAQGQCLLPGGVPPSMPCTSWRVGASAPCSSMQLRPLTSEHESYSPWLTKKKSPQLRSRRPSLTK